ncbi:MAG: nucleotide exchange factor GrpE [Verrucomicrobia bacterium]|nr:nucleotide exchange factor GrpE [Verrucomicrobiota bacterium]
MDNDTNNPKEPAPAPGTTGDAAAPTPPPATPPLADAPSSTAGPAAPKALSPEAMVRLEAEAAKAREHWDRLLRTAADFENYKKRAVRERQESSKYACAPVLERLIPVLDHFDMALAAAQSATPDSLAAFHDGVTMIYQQLRTALRESGLEEIEAVGQVFDPNWHEAVSQEPTPDVPEGQVTRQLRKGYKLRDRLLRPAKVVVAKAPDVQPVSEAAQPKSTD